MRIGILTHTIDQKGTGSGTSFRRLVRHLLAQNPGHDVFLMHYNPALSEPLYQQTEEIILPQSFLPASMAIRKLNLDIVHYHGGVVLPTWFVNAKKVVTVHGGAELFLEKYGKHRTRIFKNHIRPFYWRKMERIFTVSNHSKNLLAEKNNIPAEKIVVTYNGVDEDFHPLVYEECEDVLACYSIHRPFFFHLSRFSWRKNPAALLKAFAGIKDRTDYQLVIGGRGWQNQHVKQIIDSSDLQERVVFLDYVPKPDLIKLLNIASVFIYPSLYEGFGMPNLEAMACGCPVISSRVSAIPRSWVKRGFCLMILRIMKCWRIQ